MTITAAWLDGRIIWNGIRAGVALIREVKVDGGERLIFAYHHKRDAKAVGTSEGWVGAKVSVQAGVCPDAGHILIRERMHWQRVDGRVPGVVSREDGDSPWVLVDWVGWRIFASTHR